MNEERKEQILTALLKNEVCTLRSLRCLVQSDYFLKKTITELEEKGYILKKDYSETYEKINKGKGKKATRPRIQRTKPIYILSEKGLYYLEEWYGLDINEKSIKGKFPAKKYLSSYLPRSGVATLFSSAEIYTRANHCFTEDAEERERNRNIEEQVNDLIGNKDQTIRYITATDIKQKVVERLNAVSSQNWTEASIDSIAAPFTGMLETPEKSTFVYAPPADGLGFYLKRDYGVYVKWYNQAHTIAPHKDEVYSAPWFAGPRCDTRFLASEMDGLVYVEDSRHFRAVILDPFGKRKKKDGKDPLGEGLKHLYVVPNERGMVTMLTLYLQDKYEDAKKMIENELIEENILAPCLNPPFTAIRVSDGLPVINLMTMDVKQIFRCKEMWDNGVRFAIHCLDWQKPYFNQVFSKDMTYVISC